MDWPAQRYVSVIASRARDLLGYGGTLRTVTAAARLAHPHPLGDDEIAWLDEVAREQRGRVGKDLAGFRWPMTAAVSRRRLQRLSSDLAALDKRLGDRLYAAAVVAYRDALRRAGVKAQVRAKNRGKAAQAALDAEGMTDVVLAAINVAPDELLDRAFDAYGVSAADWIKASNKKRAELIAATFDNSDVEEDDPPADHRAEEAALLLAALLLGRARQQLGVTKPGEPVTVAVPFADVRTALRVRDGWRVLPTVTAGPPRATETTDFTLVPPPSDAIEELLGRAAPQDQTFTRFYEWVHGYFGEPKTAFGPHLDLDGAQYDDQTRADVLAADPGEWPFVAQYAVDDHDDCTCYEVITYEPAEG